MEDAPAIPDEIVENPPGCQIQKDDLQLKAAVAKLLKQTESK